MVFPVFCLSFVFCLSSLSQGDGEGSIFCLLAFYCMISLVSVFVVCMRFRWASVILWKNVMDDFFLLVRVVASAYVMSWRAVIIA